MTPVTRLEVFYKDAKVGTLALYKRYLAAFEYDKEWLGTGFSISPLKLPLREGVFIPKYDPFDGLFGIFADSLPDGWGRLLVDRMLQNCGTDPAGVDAMTRLSIVGASGMGALEYRPEAEWKALSDNYDYDELALRCKRILAGSGCEEGFDTIFRMGSSSGGARPKVLTQIDGEDWMVKFPSSHDPSEIGIMEHDYMACAEKCGISVPEYNLFFSEHCSGYFGMKRFDRHKDSETTGKLHMASVSALIEVSHRVPSLDYNTLMALTWSLTKDISEIEELYRRMCFNVYSHNRDDHARNFSFLFDGKKWMLSPAYDLTYSSSIGGEHATSVNGNGKDPGIKELVAVGTKAGITEKKARELARQIEETVNGDLHRWTTPDYQ